MKICSEKGLAMARGTPVNMTYHKPSIFHNHEKLYQKNKIAIKFVYYTECDQIVKYDSMNTLKALSLASNESTFFVGRRREKVAESAAEDYMGGLDVWRECGTPGYSMSWPKEVVVRMEEKKI